MARVEEITLQTERFAIAVAPERGASITRFAWRRPDGAWRELMHRPAPDDVQNRSGSLSALSSFVMLPFANRIDAARFCYDGQVHGLPMNRPSQNCAIHGLARGAAWSVADATPTSAEFALDASDDGAAFADTPYRFRARQTLAIESDTVIWRVAVENAGPAAMPFGFGLHPWFPRTAASRLRFSAETTFKSDERTLPIASAPVAGPTDFSEGRLMEEVIGMDRHYAGWRGDCVIAQPDLGYAIDLRSPATPETGAGTGHYPNLHIFCAPDRAHFCVEPVTHVTDVVNRRHFAGFGDMRRLEPGAAFDASVVIAVRALDGSSAS